MATGIETNRTSIALPKEISTEIIQKAQEASAVMSLSRQIALPGRGVTIPVIVSDPEAAWVNETDEKPASNATLSTKDMEAYTLAVIEPFSNQFRRDMPALYDALVARLPLVLAAKFDNTVFGGTQVPGNNFDTLDDATGQSILPGQSGTGTYDGLVAADIDIATHGGILNGFAISPQARGILLTAKDTTNRPLFINSVSEGAIPMILGSRTVQSKGVYVAGTPSTVGFAGDWTKAVYGVVESVRIDISDQATIKVGNSQINLWQRNMFAVRAEIEVGFRADLTVFNKLTGENAS